MDASSLRSSASPTQQGEQRMTDLAHQSSYPKEFNSLTAPNDGYSVPDDAENPNDEYLDKKNKSRVSGTTSPAERGIPSQDASLEGIGKLSLLLDSEDPRQGSAGVIPVAERQELTLSPIPFSARSSFGEAVHLPRSAEDSFALEAASESLEASRPAVQQAAESLQEPVSTRDTISTPNRPGSVDHRDGYERGDDLNNSAASNGSVASRGSSLGELEMERVTEELGASSMEFIRRIRAAAFRRKLDVTRSRDSLAAKERERDKAIAASRAAEERTIRRMTEPVVAASASIPTASQKVARHPPSSSFDFHARPLPKTTGPKGSGGMSGVPTVVKKSTTVPNSPLLGPRRRGRSRQRQALPKDEVPPQPTLSDDDDDSSRSPSPTRDQNIFRALPLPKSSTESGHGGMSGVPKIPKRPATIPRSPLLGFRRQPQASGNPPGKVRVGAATHGIPTVKKRQTTVPRSPLLGLRRFAKQSQEKSDAQPADPAVATPVVAPQQKLLEQQSSRRSLTSSVSNSSNLTPLVGLHLVDSGSKIECPPSSRDDDRARQAVTRANHSTELRRAASAAPPARSHDDRDEYRPHSTARAEQRARFEARRAELEKERQEALSRNRREQVQALKREMKGLRPSLSQ
jgi:hypothetical protein